MKRGLKLVLNSLLIAAIGVFIINYFSHKFLSSPMETLPYFLVKSAVYFIFSLLFLGFINLEKKEFLKVAGGGIIVALIWGAYYNVLPGILNYSPFGISLYGLTFLGMGVFGTGLAFGIVHTLAFVGGYYISKLLFHKA